MKTNFGFIAFLVTLAILLSTVNSEGHEINPKTRTQFNGSMNGVVSNGNWAAMNVGGTFAWVKNQEGHLWLLLDDEAIGVYGVGQIFFMGENILVGGGRRYPYSSPKVGIWDLSNPMPEFQSVRNLKYHPSGMYHPQNWEIICPGEARKIFVSAKNNLIGVYDGDGYITTHKFSGTLRQTQEFFVGNGTTSIVADDDYLAVGDGHYIKLYRYDPRSELYDQISEYSWTPDPQLNLGQQSLGISVIDNKVYLVIHEHFRVFKVLVVGPQYPTEPLNIFELTQVDYLEVGILSIDGEILVLGDGSVRHLPSGKNFGKLSLSSFQGELGYKLHASVLDSVNGFEIVSTEFKDNGAVGYITTYSEPTFKVSKPAKVRRGAAEFLTIPGLNPDCVRVLQGGEVHLAISASPGNRLYSIKEGGENKIVKKEVGSVIYAVSNVQSDLEVSATIKKSKGMKEYSVYTPSQRTIGRPLPSGEKPWRWFTSLSPGTWVTYKVNPVDVWTNIFTKIIVKPNGKVRTFPLVF